MNDKLATILRLMAEPGLGGNGERGLIRQTAAAVIEVPNSLRRDTPDDPDNAVCVSIANLKKMERRGLIKRDPRVPFPIYDRMLGPFTVYLEAYVVTESGRALIAARGQVNP